VATAAEITTLLASHDLPPGVVEELVDGLPGTLLLDESAEVLAADLALCHPPLAPTEVRVQVRPAGDSYSRRVTVVAHDRPGLLAATAGALAERGLSVVSAGAATWEHLGVALQGVTVVDPERRAWGSADWSLALDDVREVSSGSRRPAVAFQPAGPVKVVASPVLDGHALVTVVAPDKVGLLWAIASWFEAGGYNVLAAQLSDDGQGRANDTFLVDRSPDVDRLLARLAGERRAGSWLARLRRRRSR
jgi:predicted amino acid-binding ACT domain protein